MVGSLLLMAQTDVPKTLDPRAHKLAALADGMEGRLPAADEGWMPEAPRWVSWLIPAVVGRAMALSLRKRMAGAPVAPADDDRHGPVGLAIWQHIATESQWCPEVAGNGYAATLRALSRVKGLGGRSVQERLREAVIFGVSAETSTLIRTILFSILRTIGLAALSVFIAIWQGDSVPSTFGILAIMGLVALLGNAAISARLLTRGRAPGPRARFVYAVVVLAAGSWALDDMVRSGGSDPAWWRVSLEGVLVVAAAALLARLLFTGAAIVLQRRQLRDHVDDRFLYCYVRILHLASQHKREWGAPDLAREIDRALEDAAQSVEQGLASRLGFNRAGRRELRAPAREVAAAVRARKDELAKTGGRERLVEDARSAIKKVIDGHWRDLPTAPAAPEVPLRRRVYQVVQPFVPLVAGGAAYVGGVQLPEGYWMFALAWLPAGLATILGGDTFARTAELTKTVQALVPGGRPPGDGRAG